MAPTLDPDMRESVSILESDINKTIENNDKKLKEEQMRLERILQQQRAQSSTQGLMTSSERSSYDLSLDFVTPIIETIPEDERIEVIQTSEAEFNFDEGLSKVHTDQTPSPPIFTIDEEGTTKMGAAPTDELHFRAIPKVRLRRSKSRDPFVVGGERREGGTGIDVLTFPRLLMLLYLFTPSWKS